MLKKISFIFIFTCIFSSVLLSQEDMKYKITSYIDTYFATDNDHQPKPWDVNETPPASAFTPRQYTFIDQKKNQFDVNIAQISGAFDYKGTVRGEATLQYGSLVNSAYGGSPIQEAYLGVKVLDGLWIDAGYYMTHIGLEVYLPKENWLSSHSIVTYFEPFYHAGIKATYTTGAITAQVHLCNGSLVLNDNNDNKTLGIFLSYNPSEKFMVSYASVIGNEEPGSPNNYKLHMLHNICLGSKLNDKLELKAQIDLATKEKVKLEGSELKTGSYLGLSLQGRYSFSEKTSLSARISNINDVDNVYATGLSGTEATLGFEYKPVNFSYLRLEGSYLTFDKGTNDFGSKFIGSDGKATNSRMSLMLHFGVWID